MLMSSNIIARKYYADKVDSWIGKGQIIVLTGQRRAGKSYVLKEFSERHGVEPDANMIYVNKESRLYDTIKTYADLNSYVEAHFIRGKHNYILIDEIQEIGQWEKSVRSYRIEDNTDIIITGSNSSMLSGELATLLGGRYHEIHIQPLSYDEFLVFHRLEDNDTTLWKYLNYGGLPGLAMIGLEVEEHIWGYLRDVYNSIILTDIIARHNVRNVAFLMNLVRFFADTTGKLHSVNSICKYMKNSGLDISARIIASYLDYFKEAYLISPVRRYDLHGKKILEINDKLYFGDVGLRNFVTGGGRDADIEKIIENVVYSHLLHQGYEVYVGQLQAGEIDFVCSKANERKYVQVAYMIADDATRAREFGRLESIRDNYPKYVISMTPLVVRNDSNGITHLGLREFLLNGLK